MKKCSNCNNFKQIYRNFTCQFGTYKLYYCTLNEVVATKDGLCKSWQPKGKQADFSKQRFDEVEQDIKFISDYIRQLK